MRPPGCILHRRLYPLAGYPAGSTLYLDLLVFASPRTMRAYAVAHGPEPARYYRDFAALSMPRRRRRYRRGHDGRVSGHTLPGRGHLLFCTRHLSPQVIAHEAVHGARALLTARLAVRNLPPGYYPDTALEEALATVTGNLTHRIFQHLIAAGLRITA